ncbi:hypothetical protein [Methylocapsa sp. S129]|uniref:hypothetical protein n=1 Tax=Methylocapsa sp. S129 TaxID=1641869 RepID=UPI00131B293F|nr:hypothetical protein [Methylocapsa sp. S129]
MIKFIYSILKDVNMITSEVVARQVGGQAPLHEPEAFRRFRGGTGARRVFSDIEVAQPLNRSEMHPNSPAPASQRSWCALPGGARGAIDRILSAADPIAIIVTQALFILFPAILVDSDGDTGAYSSNARRRNAGRFRTLSDQTIALRR